MEYQPLDVTVISADGIRDVNTFTKMDVYVVVYVTGDPHKKHKTDVDKDAGTSPRWNHTISLQLPVSSSAKHDSLVFVIKSDRVMGDKDVGEVSVPIADLLSNSDGLAGGGKAVEYKVKPKGTLKFSYKLGEKFTLPLGPTGPAPKTGYPADVPVAAYPYPAHPGGPNGPYQQPPLAYPPPQQYGGGYGGHPPGVYAPAAYPPGGYGYPGQPVGGYLYPGQPSGYGYPVQQPKKKTGSRLGLGLGAGLLGGLLLGDMVSDVGEMSAYDAGYDAGFDDAGGF